MKHKSETFEKFKEFQSEVENHNSKKINFLRSDHGGEYLSYEFGLHLKQRNGVSECRNRTLLDMVQSMMSLIDLPLSFWGYALETTAYTLNRAPSKSGIFCDFLLSNMPTCLEAQSCHLFIGVIHSSLYAK